MAHGIFLETKAWDRHGTIFYSQIFWQLLAAAVVLFLFSLAHPIHLLLWCVGLDISTPLWFEALVFVVGLPGYLFFKYIY